MLRRIVATLAFDTHKAFKTLKEAGFNDPQAEAVVAIIGDALSGNMAMNAEGFGMRGMRAEIAEFRAEIAEFRAEIADHFSRLYRHLLGVAIMIVGLTSGLTVTLVKLFP